MDKMPEKDKVIFKQCVSDHGDIFQKVAVEQVKKEAFRLARIVRVGMFGIADRIAAEIAGISDPFVIHKKLTDEIRSALAEVKAHE